MNNLPRIAVAIFCCLASFTAEAYHEIAGGPIVVNGEELDSPTGYQLMQAYGAIPAGDYWYDPVSGFWKH